jgi:hypothetical protein
MCEEDLTDEKILILNFSERSIDSDKDLIKFIKIVLNQNIEKVSYMFLVHNEINFSFEFNKETVKEKDIIFDYVSWHYLYNCTVVSNGIKFTFTVREQVFKHDTIKFIIDKITKILKNGKENS